MCQSCQYYKLVKMSLFLRRYIRKAELSFEKGGAQNSVTLISVSQNRSFTGVTAIVATSDVLSHNIVW